MSPVWRRWDHHDKGGTDPDSSVGEPLDMMTDMNPRLRSALGEHLVVVLVVAMIIVGSLAAVPSLMAQTADTQTQVQNRMNLPLTMAAELDGTP